MSDSGPSVQARRRPTCTLCGSPNLERKTRYAWDATAGFLGIGLVVVLGPLIAAVLYGSPDTESPVLRWDRVEGVAAIASLLLLVFLMILSVESRNVLRCAGCGAVFERW